ncbi:hypothetical protein JEQ12_018579 [Ovis aries]|uniref:Ig-like domain-containing protein n=1 Tax=Ovis aries TaxID=9940 RepID=A0A836AER3_SHEEP|nr:hypothetical protein JEQ12_018579 [Ovis aries]
MKAHLRQILSDHEINDKTRGDSVTQLSGQVTLPEKAAVTINCTYLATGHPTLFCFSALDFPGPILFSSFSEHGTHLTDFVTQRQDMKSFIDNKIFHRKGTEAQGKARAVLALLGMWPTGFGSPVVNIPISAAPPDKPPVLTEKSREQGSFSFANMHPVTHSVLLIILVLGGTNGDSVNQTEGPVTVSERALMTLNCTYQTADFSSYLYWYVQHLNKAPQLLLKGLTADKKLLVAPEMLLPKHNYKNAEFNSYNGFNIPGGCSPQDYRGDLTRGMSEHPPEGLRGEDRVEQSPQTLGIQEGDSLSLNCSYTVSHFRGLQWYRQDPGKGPELLFLLYSVGDEKQEERLRATLLKKGSSLHFEAPKPEDSATYLCAVQTQCSPGTCRLYPNPEAAALE